MGTIDVEVKPLPLTRIVAVTGTAASAESSDVGPVVQRLFGRLGRFIDEGTVTPVDPAVVAYTPVDGEGLRCQAGFTATAAAAPDGVELVALPAFEAAATLVHRGTMAGIGESYQRLAVWIEENGYRTDGTAREVYLVSHPEPQENWVTEIQMPVTTT